MSYSQSESDFNCVINLLSHSDSTSEYDESESDFS